MGHRKRSAPHRGSLGYWPRKRAKRITARWRSWPNHEGPPAVLGFAGYKVGMTHIAMIEDNPGSLNYKQEVFVPVTVLEVPPIKAFAVRIYSYDETYETHHCIGQIWAESFAPQLSRRIKVPKEPKPVEEIASKLFEEFSEEIREVRLLAHTQPYLAGFPQKTPHVLEIKVGGSNIKEVYDHVINLLPKSEDAEKTETEEEEGEQILQRKPGEISFTDAFEIGKFVDVTAVSKGKGFQGVIKRHGVKVLTRKKRKGRRVVGSIGPWHPARVMWTVPRAGQLGFHARTEYNKRILKYGRDGNEINPPSGFKHYGLVRSEYVLLKGSVPGPAKRLIRLRLPIRPPSNINIFKEPDIRYVSTTPKN